MSDLEISAYNCSLCCKAIATETAFSRDIPNSSGDMCHKFLILLSRYLNLNVGLFNLKQTMGTSAVQKDLIDKLRLCKDCYQVADSFCDMYDLLQQLHLEINRNVEKIAEVISTGGNPGEGQMVQYDSRRIMSFMDFKMAVTKGVSRKRKRCYPQLKLNDIAGGSKKVLLPSSPGYADVLKSGLEMDTHQPENRLISEDQFPTIMINDCVGVEGTPESIDSSGEMCVDEENSNEDNLHNVSESDNATCHDTLDDKEDNKVDLNLDKESVERPTTSAVKVESSEDTVEVKVGEHIKEQIFRCDTCSKKFLVQNTPNGISQKEDAISKIRETKNPAITKGKRQMTHSARRMGRSHASVLPTTKLRYKCKLCEKCFVDRGRLIIHKRFHSGEKPFKFKNGSRWFIQKANVITRMRTPEDARNRSNERSIKF